METAIVVKNKNDLIQAFQKQSLFSPHHQPMLSENAQQEYAAIIPTEDQYLPLGRSFKGHKIILGIQPQFDGKIKGHLENLEVIRGPQRLNYSSPLHPPHPGTFFYSPEYVWNSEDKFGLAKFIEHLKMSQTSR